MVQRATWSPPAHHYGIGIVAGVILLYSHRALDTNPHFGLSWTALCQSSQPHCIRVPILVRNHISSFTHNLHEHSYYRELTSTLDPMTATSKAQATSSVPTAYNSCESTTATFPGGEYEKTVPFAQRVKARALRPTPVVDSGSVPLRGRSIWTWLAS